MKVKKLLLSLVLILVATVLVINTNTFAADGSWKLGVEKVREGKTTQNGKEVNTTRYSYQMTTGSNSKPVLKIVDKESGTPDFSNAIYCLKAGKGFGSDEATIVDKEYTEYFDMIREKTEVNNIINLSDANYASVLWLLDNIYLPKQTPIADRQTTKNNLLTKAIKKDIVDNGINSNYYGGDYDSEDEMARAQARRSYLTDDDIEVVQQWALWYFTNKDEANKSTFSTENLPNILVNTTGEGKHNNLADQGSLLAEWADPIKEGAARQQDAEALYKYLIDTAKANTTYSKIPTRINFNKTLTPIAKQVTELSTNYTIVGPFEIEKTGNTNYNFNGSVVDKNDKAIAYTISDADGKAISGVRTLNDVVGNGRFYIKIAKSNLISSSIEDIKLKLDYTTNDTKATFWTVNGSTVDQPVVVIERKPETIEDEISLHIPKFDLALRKYIVGVTRNGVNVPVSELAGRTPDIDKSNLKTRTNGKTAETAEYKHRKDPVPVETGDIVNYKITIYNEGEVAGRATEIRDYLPEGLEFYSAVSTDYNFEVSSNKRQIIITPKDSNNLNEYDGATLASRDIEFQCVVTKKAKRNTSEILTNVAEITDAYDVNNIRMHLVDDDRDSTPNNLVKPGDTELPSYKGKDSNKSDLTDRTYHYEGQQDDDDFEKLTVTTPEFDLALRKFMTQANGEEIDREPVVDTTPLKNGETTAYYAHPKNSITLKVGQKIVYTIRVYNEGDIDGYATVIEDLLPEELELVPASESTINTKYGWTGSGNVVTTQYLNGTIIHAFDGGDTLDYKDIQIECRIKETENLGKVLTNIAQINAATDIYGKPIKNEGDDRDSIPMNRRPISDASLPNYKGDSSNKEDLTDKDYYYKGQEDDDDFEKVEIYQPEYDLALRKFITQVEDEEITSRIPEVDTTPLTDGSNKTDAIYTHPKTPVLVQTDNVVIYTIRVYNEGKVDGYAQLVKDNIPEGLDFESQIDNPINIEYRWRLSDDGKQVSTDYLSKERDEKNVIKAFDSETMDTLDYKDVKIALKVVEPNTSTRIITNIAEIKQDDGKDIDSIPDNDVPEEDDIDVEHIKLRYFDLALRKFITKVESKTGENLPIETDTTKDVSREPKVEIGEDGKIKYIHPKDPVVVANSDIVIYTLRVYNEGTVDGFAEEIKDDVPVGLELVPEHAINVEYGWVMYDEEGNQTDDTTKAKTIRSTYLSEANSEDNKIIAFDRTTMAEPAYKEVKVAFRVIEKNVGEERIVINTAEISKDNDDDIDSTPDNDVPDEDDIDKEYVKLKYFDLSLLKWVSKVMVTEKGETKVTETGFNGLENPEPVVKLEVKPNQIKSIVIKYEYGIKITNEGQIAGYAKEVADYIPEGLEFIPEDNPLWTLKEDGKIVTTQLENTLLQPGESAIIHVVFKWKNGENNFGTKVNWAEISKDYNDKDADDIDSTPDNFKKEEDDIDKALVVLNPKTGVVAMFIVLPTIVIAIIGAGIILIKKYVL